MTGYSLGITTTDGCQAPEQHATRTTLRGPASLCGAAPITPAVGRFIPAQPGNCPVCDAIIGAPVVGAVAVAP